MQRKGRKILGNESVISFFFVFLTRISVILPIKDALKGRKTEEKWQDQNLNS